MKPFIGDVCHIGFTPKANGPYAPFRFESIKKQLWRNKQSDRPISDSEIKAVLSQLLKTDQWLPPAGHVSEDVTSHASGPFKMPIFSNIGVKPHKPFTCNACPTNLHTNVI
ncbi:hypothetical protein AVEN_232076-1 [Araneus ventricosus]|uniref:Uncharacterized protein n=1 Tax=Araneus ventricosus TaxID=182803 RepID=A0A4Y2QLB4_ARAVE|nr:hypothetical protein AVEN_232076-1 [Araneus ventricosus]